VTNASSDKQRTSASTVRRWLRNQGVGINRLRWINVFTQVNRTQAASLLRQLGFSNTIYMNYGETRHRFKQYHDRQTRHDVSRTGKRFIAWTIYSKPHPFLRCCTIFQFQRTRPYQFGMLIIFVCLNFNLKLFCFAVHKKWLLVAIRVVLNLYITETKLLLTKRWSDLRNCQHFATERASHLHSQRVKRCSNLTRNQERKKDPLWIDLGAFRANSGRLCPAQFSDFPENNIITLNLPFVCSVNVLRCTSCQQITGD